jgi:hypothetical protein
VRRVIISVVVGAALALPGSAEASVYTGDVLGIVLRQKSKLREITVFGGLPLNCDEGKTTTDGSLDISRWRWNPPYPRVKHHRFHVVEPKTQAYAVVGNDGNVVGTERDEYVLDARGRFNKSYRKASGTVRITGSYRGPSPLDPELQIQYHNCDSGTVQWKVHSLY